MKFIEEFNKSEEEKEIEQRINTIWEKPGDKLRLNILRDLRK